MTGSCLLFLDEMKMSLKGKGGNRKASAVWGNRSSIRNQALLQKEGEGSTLGYLQNLTCADICCLPGGVLLVFGVCQAEVWERCLVK